MSHYHAIVWMDHLEAKVFHFSPGAADKLVVRSHSPDRHLHHRAGSRDGKHAADDHHFFDEIVRALDGAREWLVVGPGNAKTGFVAHVEAHHAGKRPMIVAVETVDHPTDGELLKTARARAEAIDRMRPRDA